MMLGSTASPENLIGAREQGGRHREAESIRGLQVDDEFERDGLFHREIRGLGALEDLIDVPSGAPKLVSNVRPIRHQAADLRILPVPVHGGQPVPRRQKDDLASGREKNGILSYQERVGALTEHRGERTLEFVAPADFYGL